MQQKQKGTAEVTLETTKRAFAVWRLNKTRGDAPIPDHLWDMIRQLLSDYEVRTICSQLGVTREQAINYFASQTNRINNQVDKDDVATMQVNNNFVEVKPKFDQADDLNRDNTVSITIEHINGSKMYINADNISASSVVSSFLGERS